MVCVIDMDSINTCRARTYPKAAVGIYNPA